MSTWQPVTIRETDARAPNQVEPDEALAAWAARLEGERRREAMRQAALKRDLALQAALYGEGS